MPLLWVGSMLFCSQVVRGEEAIISTDDSRVKVVVIPTDEELLIASDTMAILDK